MIVPPTTDTLTAGRELDALVAERVMGFCAHQFVHKPSAYMRSIPGGNSTGCSNGPLLDFSLSECSRCGLRTGHDVRNQQTKHQLERIESYSTSIASAWELVEKFTPHGVAVQCCREQEWGDDKWKCLISTKWTPHEYVEARGDTAPLAICLAALKAVVGETEATGG